MVIYWDVLFGVNALMDGVSLLAAARLGGVPVKRGRLVLACLAGGAYAVCAAMWPVAAVLPLRLLSGIGLCALAFGKTRALVRSCCLYILVSAMFAGMAAALGVASGRRLLYGAGYYFAVPLRTLLLAATVGYAVSGILLRGDAQHGVLRCEVERVTIRCFGREAQLRLLHDTGNDLTEPVSGRPAIVLDRAAAQAVLGSGIRLTGQNAAAQLAALPPEAAARFGLLPYRAVGTEAGLLLYFRPDTVQRADGSLLNCVCAVGPAQIGRGAYDGLIGI